jgi:hypothetical protein
VSRDDVGRICMAFSLEAGRHRGLVHRQLKSANRTEAFTHDPPQSSETRALSSEPVEPQDPSFLAYRRLGTRQRIRYVPQAMRARAQTQHRHDEASPGTAELPATLWVQGRNAVCEGWGRWPAVKRIPAVVAEWLGAGGHRPTDGQGAPPPKILECKHGGYQPERARISEPREIKNSDVIRVRQ